MFGLPTWFDVTTSAPTTSIPFYLELFGWTVKPLSDTEYGKYLLFHKDGLPVAGLVERGPGTTQPDGWLTYLSTSDIQATLTTAAANKGETQRPALEVVGIGELAVLTDPVRSSIGVAQLGADTQTAPAGPGTPVWTEIETVDWPVTVDFLTATFGVHTENQSTTPGSRFATVHDENQPRGGIFELPADVPHSRWEVAFLVDDAQQAVDRAVALGAQIVRPVYPVPVGTGFGARLADPAGAHFNVIAF